MEFVGAFPVCALISLVAQIIIECIPEIHGPTLFLGIQILGAVLVPSGVIALLMAAGQAGLVITVFNAGASVCENVINIWMGQSPINLLIVLGVFLVVAIFGVLAGYFRAKIVKRRNGLTEEKIPLNELS